MSNFSRTLNALMEKCGISGVRLAESSGISEPVVSRIRSGEKDRIERDELERLAQAVSLDPKERAMLIAAHLMDERVGDGRELVRIQVTDQAQSGVANDARSPLLNAEGRALQIIRDNFHDPDVRDMVFGLANLLERGDVRPDPPQPAKKTAVAKIYKPGSDRPKGSLPPAAL